MNDDVRDKLEALILALLNEGGKTQKVTIAIGPPSYYADGFGTYVRAEAVVNGEKVCGSMVIPRMAENLAYEPVAIRGVAVAEFVSKFANELRRSGARQEKA
jgi:hypothetical protein